MKALVARPGKIAAAPFNKMNTLQPIASGGSPYTPGWDSREAFPSGADEFWQNPPSAYVEQEPFYIWRPSGTYDYYGASTLYPNVSVDNQVLSADAEPTNGRMSFGDGKFRYGITDIWRDSNGYQVNPELGYIYEKRKVSDWPNRLLTYYDSNAGQWIMDGWYKFGINYFVPETQTIVGNPVGSLLTHLSTSSNISATLDWPGLCKGSKMSDMQAVGQSGTARKFGIPIWKGNIRWWGSSSPSLFVLAGVPTFNEETQKIDLEFILTDQDSVNYTSKSNPAWAYTHRYNTAMDGTPKDIRSVYYRGNQLSSGWFEFEPPSSLVVGSTLQLTNYIAEGVEGTPNNATLELSGFAEYRGSTINPYQDIMEGGIVPMECGMLLGTFNVGTMIY